MTPDPRTVGPRPATDTLRHQPAAAGELRRRAWTAVLEADGGPVTAVQLAAAAGITRGAAARFLADWTAAGIIDRGSLPPGRHIPYATPHTARLLAAALAAAGRGWHVFPLAPDAKRPAVKDWERRATTDPARVRAAWSAGPYGIGVACGPSGLCVIDLDRPKPGQAAPGEWGVGGVHDGSDVLAVLAERAGRPYPGDTYVVRTGSGGLHLYFTRPAGAELRNTAGALGWLVDTRAAGGYVVAAGSTVDGHPYRVVADRQPAQLPDWLAATLTRPATLASPTALPADADRLLAYLRAAVAGELARVAAATEGSRNHTLYIAAVALGQLAAGGALPAERVITELEQAAAGVGLGQAEAVATIRSGLRAGARRPRTLDSPAGGAAA